MANGLRRPALVAVCAILLTARLAAYDRDLERVFDFMERELIVQKERAISQYLIFCGGEAFYGSFGDVGFFSMSEFDDWKDVFHLEFSVTAASQDDKDLIRSLAYLSVQRPLKLPLSALCGISGITKTNMGFDGPGTFTGITWNPNGNYTLSYLDPFFKVGLDLGALSLEGYYAGALSAFRPLYSYLMPGIHLFRDAVGLALITESYKNVGADDAVVAYLGARARFGRTERPSAAERERGWSRLNVDLRLYNIVPVDFADLRGFLRTTALEPANYVARGTVKFDAAGREGRYGSAEMYATAGAWYGLDKGLGYELALTLNAPLSMSLSGFFRANDYLSVPVRGGGPDYSFGVNFNFGFGFGRAP